MAHAPLPPQVPTQLEQQVLTTLTHDSTCFEVELTDTALADRHANGVTLRGARLSKVDLSGARVGHLTLSDAELRDCNLANLHGESAEVTRVSIGTARLTGIALPKAILRDVTIRGSRVDLASFSCSRLTRVTFEDCLLVQSDFLEAQLEHVRFHSCDLTGADFRGAQLRHCELRRSNLTDLQGVESLRGAALEWSGIVEFAGVWASALGIGVLDAD